MTRKREIWADALRGFLILMVILGHALQHGDYYHHVVWNMIYSFHMAAFFVVSGYVNYWSVPSWDTIKRRFIQLMIPFISWVILVGLRSDSPIDTIVKEIVHPAMYWFIFALFVIILLFFVSRQLAERLRIPNIILQLLIILGLTFIMIFLNPRYFGFQYIAYYYSFFVFGYYINHFRCSPSLFITCLLGLGWLVLAPFWRMQEVSPLCYHLTFIPSSLLIYSYRFIAAILGSSFFVFISNRFLNNDKSKLLSLLSYFGKESLGIYIIHIYIAFYVSTFLASALGTDVSVAFVLLDFSLKLLLSIVAIRIIKMIPVVRFLLLGVNKQK